MMTQGGPLQCGILHLCTSDFSQHHVYCSLGSRVVILAFWSLPLLGYFCTFHILCLLYIQLSSHVLVMRDKAFFFLENCSVEYMLFE